MSESRMAASASATRTSGGSCNGWFRRLHKLSFHRDTTDTRSDSRLSSAAFSDANGTVLLGLSWWNFVKVSLISPLQTLFAFQSDPLSPLLFVIPKCPTPRTSKALVLLHFSGKNSLSPLFYNGQRGLGYPWLLCLSARSKNLLCRCI